MNETVRTYFYHPEHAAEGECFDMAVAPEVYQEQIKALEADGWVDSPAKFPQPQEPKDDKKKKKS